MPPLTLITRSLLATALAFAPPSLAQSTSQSTPETTPGTAPARVGSEAETRIIMVPYRPLRTFRGQPVRVNTGASERSIGVVRPLRTTPGSVGLDERNAWSWRNRADRSDRWRSREVRHGRIVLDAYRDPYPRVERSIGVVRAFHTPQPVVRNSPFTVTNPNAPSESPPETSPQTSPESPPETSPGSMVILGPTFPDAPAAGDATVYAVRSVEELPQAQRSDPWALLNHGYYRDARAAFDKADADASAQRPVDEQAAATGRALAAALSGDLAAARRLMPDRPRVPQGFAFSDQARRRIVQTRTFLFAQDAEMQAALDTLTADPDAASAPRAN